MSASARERDGPSAATTKVHPRRAFLASLRSIVVAIALPLAGRAHAAEDVNRQFDNVRKLYDADSDLVWFIPAAAPETVDGSAFYLYFGRGEKGKLTPLRLKAICYGRRALGVQRYWASADGQALRAFPPGTWQAERMTAAWEWLDEPIANARQLHELAILAQARRAVVHFEGQRGRQRLALSDRQKHAIRDMLRAYQHSGGSVEW
jgi:hypothetical protein